MKRILLFLTIAAMLAGAVSPALASRGEKTFGVMSRSVELDFNINSGMPFTYQWIDPDAADTDAVLSLADCDSAAAGTYTFTSTHNDIIDFPRTIDITVSGPGDSCVAAIPTGNWVLTGTNILGETISETYASAANTEATLAGTCAFKTLTSLAYPADDGDGDLGLYVEYSIGLGGSLGMPFAHENDTCVFCTNEGVTETTTPVVTADLDEIEKNIITFTNAPDAANTYQCLFWILKYGNKDSAKIW